MTDYNEEINIITTPKGDKVITMPKERLVEITNAIYDGVEYMKSKNLNATAEVTLGLWKVLVKKGDC